MQVIENGRRPDDGVQFEAERFQIRDAAGNLWRVYEGEPGELTLSLSSAVNGDGEQVSIRPESSNMVRIRQANA